MAKKKSKKKQSHKVPKESFVKPTNLGFWGKSKLHYLIIAIFSFLLYANTIGHDYTQDDAIVIYDNMYTQQGVQGIPGLLQKDTFFGFFKTEGKAKLVSGGRYRPLTPVMFAVGWEIFGNNPTVGHLLNIFWYSLLAMFLFAFLKALVVNQKPNSTNMLLVFLATLLFVAHPIHTEVVANIKGRDEIMALLGSILAGYLILDNKFKTWLNGIIVGVIFFLALMSKENTITFLGVMPLALYLFRNLSIVQIVKKTTPLFVATIVFLIVRTSVLGFDFGGTPSELMNNPFLKVINGQYVDFSFSEKAATIIFTLGKYLQLLVFPVQLTHDYYPYQIPIMDFGNWQVWLSILTYLVLGFFAVFKFGKKSIPSFCILYFFMTLSIVSNIVFPIGTNMSERFLFMPSVGFALLLAIMLVKYVFKKFGTLPFAILCGSILILFSAKTITRNMVWKDDFTLFQTDVKTSTNSAKVLNAAGGSLLAKVETEKDPQKKIQMANEAIVHLQKAIKLHPAYRNAYLLMGNAYFFKSDYLNAINNYNKVLELSPGHPDGTNNLAVAMRDYGRFLGEKNGDLQGSLNYLNQSYQLSPNDPETIRLLGINYGISGRHAEALPYFKRTTELAPNIVGNWINLSRVYMEVGDMENANLAKQKALELDPNSFN